MIDNAKIVIGGGGGSPATYTDDGKFRRPDDTPADGGFAEQGGLRRILSKTKIIDSTQGILNSFVNYDIRNIYMNDTFRVVQHVDDTVVMNTYQWTETAFVKYNYAYTIGYYTDKISVAPTSGTGNIYHDVYIEIYLEKEGQYENLYIVNT